MSATEERGAVRYILVDNQEASLYEEVEALLENGWRLYGYPFSHNGCIVQCLILEENLDKTAK